MTDPMHPLDPGSEDSARLFTGEGLMGEGGSLAWSDTWDEFWRDAFATRPYVPADARYEHYRGAYRYGHEAAGRHRAREWTELEPELAGGWGTYEHRGASGAEWHAVREAVRDGWQRAREVLKL